MSGSTVRHGLLTILLLLSVALPARAGEPSVAFINGQLQGAYGRVDGNDLRVGGASLAIPIGHLFGLQVDGAYGEIDLV